MFKKEYCDWRVSVKRPIGTPYKSAHLEISVFIYRGRKGSETRALEGLPHARELEEREHRASVIAYFVEPQLHDDLSEASLIPVLHRERRGVPVRPPSS